MTYYTIYQITNKINGKIYIGSHKTKNLNDNYLGSGKYLKHAIVKHGVENFTKEILFVFDSAEEMYAKEAELVNAEFIAESNTYNLKVGGFGGFDYINSSGINNKANQCSKAGKAAAKAGGGFKGKTHSDATKRHLSATLHGRVATFAGKTHTIEAKHKISEKNKVACSGVRNSQYGTMWITNGQQNKKIKHDEIMPGGWYQGRKQIWRVNQVGPGTSC